MGRWGLVDLWGADLIPLMPWTLAIDYGTSFTAAATRDGDGRPERLEVGDSHRFPSYVYLDEGGELLLGRPAHNSARVAPQRFERSPKRSIGVKQVLLLGDRHVEVGTRSPRCSPRSATRRSAATAARSRAGCASPIPRCGAQSAAGRWSRRRSEPASQSPS